MSKEAIQEYVEHTPYNINPAVLKSELERYKEKIQMEIIDKTITEIHSNANEIYPYTFQSCTELTSADFPKATKIGEYAFRGCTKLKIANFPAVTSIGENVWTFCNALTELRLSSPTFCVAEGDPMLSFKCKIYVPQNLIEQYKVAENWSLYAAQFVAID